ncbi:terpene synthase family protein [Streptomyces sp. CB02923]|uniref:terpene synthase family protein n=1 Tax=Streptomyces sp. CB02923 TaxID=1718985 RepID=UPI0018FFA465|nr:hypothetical protein [Streptomyces sp. CB02923]
MRQDEHPGTDAAYRVPDFTLPFPERSGPYAETACRDGDSWITRAGLFPDPAVRAKIMAARTGDLATRAMPFADEDMVLLLNRWILWTLALDEFFDGLPFEDRVTAFDRVFGDVAESLTTGKADHPMTVALVELWRATVTPMSAVWERRFRRNTLRFIHAMRVESVHHTSSPPGIPDYIAERRYSFWCYAAMDLVERAEMFDVPVDVYRSEPYQGLYEAGADIAGWTNDVFSAPAELAKGEMLTLPGLLMLQQGCALQSAALQTLGRIYRRVGDFLDHQARLRVLLDDLRCPAEERDRVIRCADGIATWLVANHDWHRRSSRYK